MYKKNIRPSFQVQKAIKIHECIWCGKAINPGSTYYSKGEHSQRLAQYLEEHTGESIEDIKKKTHAQFCDFINWKFCSTECMSEWSQWTFEKMPFNVRGRMLSKIAGILEKVQETLRMMSALGGKRKEELDGGI
jgi:hypothetical protein